MSKLASMVVDTESSSKRQASVPRGGPTTPLNMLLRAARKAVSDFDMLLALAY